MSGEEELREALSAAVWSKMGDQPWREDADEAADAILALPEVAALLADAERVRNVRELHQRDGTVPYACDYCGRAWPCDVIHALDTALTTDPT